MELLPSWGRSFLLWHRHLMCFTFRIGRFWHTSVGHSPHELLQSVSFR